MKTIALFELMSLIKRGQAPIKIIWEEETYTFVENIKDYKRCDDRLLFKSMNLLNNHLEDIVKIVNNEKILEK